MELSEAKIWNEHWRLAALTRVELIKIGLVSIIIGFTFIIFHFQGNTMEPYRHGRSAVGWVHNINRQMGGDFSHGSIIPLISLVVLWLKRHDIAAVMPKSSSKLGLFVVISALLMHWVGLQAQQTRLSLTALIVLIWGIPFYLFGWKMAKVLLFPATYLIFALPLTFIDDMTFPLRMFAAGGSVFLLNGLGIESQQVGSAVISTGFEFDVADPCSGIRSLLALTALTAVYSYLFQKTLIKKWILFLTAIPLAIIGNVGRITTIALAAEAFGEPFAYTLYHDWSGFVIYAIAIMFMLAIDALLRMNYREAYIQWKHANLSPISS